MNSTVDSMLIERIKQRIRAMADVSNDEVEDLILTCRKELEMKGIYGDESDHTYYQAVVLYCKANYGYDENTDRFETAYQALCNAMALSGDYKKGESG